MLKFWTVRGKERGDTLIEVTFALAILGFVLLGSTAAVAEAFRTGQTANERTTLAEAAQEQMEALRSFRDNHSWSQFRFGQNCGSGGYCGVHDALSGLAPSCTTASNCFHMVLSANGPGVEEWLPVSGAIAGPVPTSTMEITSVSQTQLPDPTGCGYDFVLHYSFTPLGGGLPDSNELATRLINLQLPVGGGPCP
jgi:type II secretory pathway pseudopilin PulG